MKALITGANGQLGLELQRQLKELKEEIIIIATDYQELDITNINQVKDKFSLEKPDVVILCCAYGS